MASQAAFFSCGFISLGLIFMIVGGINLNRAWGSLHWPTTEGQILSAQIARTSEGSRYLPLVHYRYSVKENSYTSSRISFRETGSMASPDPETSKAVIACYKPGQTVRVSYDPVSPDRAVLEPGASLPAFLPMGIGGLFFVIGLITGLFSWI